MTRRSFNVLIGVDGSDDAATVVAHVCDSLGTAPGRVALVRVIDDRSDTLATRRALDGLRALNADHPSLEAACVLLFGDPASSLHEYAVTYEYDVIVVGERGQGRSAPPLGSVAASLAASEGVAVVLVDPAQQTRARSGARCRSVRPDERVSDAGLLQWGT